MPGRSDTPDYGFGKGAHTPAEDASKPDDGSHDHDSEGLFGRGAGHDQAGDHVHDGGGAFSSLVDHLHFGSGAGEAGAAAAAAEQFRSSTGHDAHEHDGAGHGPSPLRSAFEAGDHGDHSALAAHGVDDPSHSGIASHGAAGLVGDGGGIDHSFGHDAGHDAAHGVGGVNDLHRFDHGEGGSHGFGILDHGHSEGLQSDIHGGGHGLFDLTGSNAPADDLSHHDAHGAVHHDGGDHDPGGIHHLFGG